MLSNGAKDFHADERIRFDEELPYLPGEGPEFNISADVEEALSKLGSRQAEARESIESLRITRRYGRLYRADQPIYFDLWNGGFSRRSFVFHEDDKIFGLMLGPFDTFETFEARMKELGALLDKAFVQGVGSIGQPSEDGEEWGYDEIPDEQIQQLPDWKDSLLMPVPGGRISSRGFGMHRHPIHGDLRMHYGQDIGAPMGASVRAAYEGIVVYTVVSDSGYGNHTLLVHKGKYHTLYAHLSRILVKDGQRVKTGDEIGKVGSTGLSTGPHLHFELHREGKAIDPRLFIKRK